MVYAGLCLSGAGTLETTGRKWTLTRHKNGFYTIQPTDDKSLALTVAGGSAKSGTRVVLQADAGLPMQRWSVVSNANGTYGLVPQYAPGSGLDDFGGNTTLGAAIDIWERWDGDQHTQWTITPAP